jgi:hypothetical protein
MAVDVVTDIVIERPPADVAAFAGDPTNATDWYANIESVVWQTEPPVQLGSRMTFVAHFLGRRLEYIYEIEPGERLTMRTAQGPFPMETTYTWEPTTPDGATSTRMTLRNRGEPSGFSKVAAPMMATAMKRANAKDLARLKRLLEAPATGNR